MSNDFKLGVAQLENKQTYTKKNWFKIQDGDNLFRILPPVHSGVERGVWAKYYAVHRGFRGSNGWMRSFICPMKKNKEKIVEIGCPVCDVYTERNAQATQMQAAGADAESIKAFKYNHVMPFQVEKKFYLNALNADNKVGILTLPPTAFYELDRVAKNLKNQHGVDITAINKGLWIKITRTGTKPRVNFAVDIAREGDSLMGSGQPKFHDLTPEIIDAMRMGTVDLLTMYKELTPEQIARIASVSDEVRPQLIDVIFGIGNAAPAESDSEPGLESSIPSLGVTLHGRVEVGAKGIQVTMPTSHGTVTADVNQQNAVAAGKAMSDAQFAQFVNANKGTQDNLKAAELQPAAPVAQTAPAATVESNPFLSPPPAASVPKPAGKVMTDDDFLSMFGSKK